MHVLIICSELGRPRSLLVFINPIAGRGRSTRIYREKVASLFELARLATEVIVTEKRHHAQNILQEIDLEQFDGFVNNMFVHNNYAKDGRLHNNVLTF